MGGIGARIADLLQYRNMSQKELATRAGITEAAVCKYIKGERVPRAVTVAAIAKALGVSVAELMGETNECEDDLDTAVRLIARNAGKLTETQKLQILSAVAKL
jgi:transcriptional regulator with XRE-family HTH domain